MSENKYNDLIEQLKADLGNSITEVGMNYGHPLIVVPLEKIHDVCEYLSDKQHFIYLIDIFGTDRYTTENRFEVIYNIVNLRTQHRILVKTHCPEDNPVVPTVTDIWEGANWYERETYDMFGIRFTGHPDLRRMYMPEDFEYYPLRKEFPLIGVPGSIELPNTTPDQD